MDIRLKSLQVIGSENLPRLAAVFVPNRIHSHDLTPLLNALNGRKFCILLGAPRVGDHPLRKACERSGNPVWMMPSHEYEYPDLALELNQALAKDQDILFVPAPARSVNGALNTIPKGHLEFLISLQAPVVPLYLLRENELRLGTEEPARKEDAYLGIGHMIPEGRINLATFIEGQLEASERAFSATQRLRGSLASHLLRGLKKHAHCQITDGMDDRTLTFDKLLSTALALRGHILAKTKAKRVGIVLPPGLGCYIANLAVIFAGKIPVNFNFTAGRKALESSIRQSEIDRMITADKVIRAVGDFPWPPNEKLILLEQVIPSLKPKIGIWLGLTKVLPASVLIKILKLDQRNHEDEVLLLFTSGSSGDPKGVPLTHKNLIGNITQFSNRISIHQADARPSILGSLPLFHSFGCTVNMFFPLIEGINIVTYRSPIETLKIAELIEKHRVTMLCSTPTFLRGFLRRVNREQLVSLRYLVTGAEKLPASLAQEFEEKFGKVVLEGYGLTETSPVTNVNLPDPVTPEGQTPTYIIPSRRAGSVGQLMPGLAAKITDPDDDTQIQPTNVSGILWLKGSNVFSGYLNDPERTQEVIRDQWFRTGDLGRIDDEGFLYIEGRLSRFSKIGGEMVPHESVEEQINKALGLEGESERKIVIVGVPDQEKGEALVLLSTISPENINQELIRIRYELLGRGVPALWIPKKLIRVPEIPVLASGKLDLKLCKEISMRYL